MAVAIAEDAASQGSSGLGGGSEQRARGISDANSNTNGSDEDDSVFEEELTPEGVDEGDVAVSLSESESSYQRKVVEAISKDGPQESPFGGETWEQRVARVKAECGSPALCRLMHAGRRSATSRAGP